MTTNATSYPRAALRRILKGHARKNIGKSVDALVYLDYVLFVEEYGVSFLPLQRLTTARLMQGAARKARSSGEKRMAAKDIRKVTMVRSHQSYGGAG